MIRIVVVDDHPVVREGLVASLEDNPEFQVVGAAGSAEDALRLVAAQRPDVILLDLELPGVNGLEAIPGLAAASGASRILILTAYDTDERVLGALRAGAKGYLLKGASLEEIARAIRAVHAGESYLEPRVATKVVAELGPTSVLPRSAIGSARCCAWSPVDTPTNRSPGRLGSPSAPSSSTSRPSLTRWARRTARRRWRWPRSAAWCSLGSTARTDGQGFDFPT